MGFFPTTPNDGDEIGPNTNGSYFKYVAVDNKWILIPNADVYSEAEVDALISAHEANPGDINHLTDAQVAALHTRLHTITDILDHSANYHKVFYSDGAGHVIELALGADGEVLTSTGAATAPAFEAPAGGGDISQAEFDAAHAIGSANKIKLSLPLGDFNYPASGSSGGGNIVQNVNAQDIAFIFTVPIPTNFIGKKLYISEIYIALEDADAGDCIDVCHIIGWAGHVKTTVDSFATDKNTPSEATYSGDGDWAGPYDCSAYDAINIQCNAICTNAADLEIGFLAIDYYYDN